MKMPSAVAIGLSALLLPASAEAQDFPNKPIRLIVPFPADGYTIGIVSASALAISPTMEKVPYEGAKELAPLTLVVTVPEMLVVAANVPAKNMTELVALAKAQ